MLEKFDVCFDDGVIRLEHLRSIGHPVGSGYVSPDKKYCYVNIPKNSSSSMKHILQDWSFENWKLACRTDVEFLVILRDPTQRWISAVSEFICRPNSIEDVTTKDTDYLNSLSIPLIKKLIFKSVYLDEHCLPQCYYLQDLLMQKIKFFNKDLDGVGQMSKYLQLTTPMERLNQSGPEKEIVKNWLIHQLTKNKELQHIIDVHYWCDHQLLDKVAVIS